MVFDSHLHVGQFYDMYHSPKDIVSLMDNLDVNCAAISSTSICEENYDKVLNEFEILINLAGDRIFPVLWVTPNMIDYGAVNLFLNSKITWKCLKIHGRLHYGVWQPFEHYMNQVIAIAQKLAVPILLHTGAYEYVEPQYYESMIKHYNNQIFILAHSRPIDQTINLLKTSSNAWADVAFSPIDDIKELVNANLTNRVLWGSDLPIISYFYQNIDVISYYNNLLESLKNSISDQEYISITQQNATTLF